MGTIKRAEERQRAIELRLQGKSYNEIRKLIGVPSKGTISYWLKGLELTPLARKKLRKNMQHAFERGFFKFNAERTKRIKKENREAFIRGKRMTGKLTQREVMLIGSALYWGEGTKSVMRTNRSISFVNSDPLMVRFFMQFIRNVLCIKKNKICGGIHLYDGTSDADGRSYWSKVTGLPAARFYVVRQVSRSSKRKRGHTLPHGTVVIRVHNRILFHQLLGMIEGLSSGLR